MPFCWSKKNLRHGWQHPLGQEEAKVLADSDQDMSYMWNLKKSNSGQLITQKVPVHEVVVPQSPKVAPWKVTDINKATWNNLIHGGCYLPSLWFFQSCVGCLVLCWYWVCLCLVFGSLLITLPSSKMAPLSKGGQNGKKQQSKTPHTKTSRICTICTYKAFSRKSL